MTKFNLILKLSFMKRLFPIAYIIVDSKLFSISSKRIVYYHQSCYLL